MNLQSKWFPDLSQRYYIRVNIIVHPILPRTRTLTLGQNLCQFWRTTQRLLLISKWNWWRIKRQCTSLKKPCLWALLKNVHFRHRPLTSTLTMLILMFFCISHTKTSWSQPTIPMTWCDYLAIFRRRPMMEVESSWTGCTSFWGRYSSWCCDVMTMVIMVEYMFLVGCRCWWIM